MPVLKSTKRQLAICLHIWCVLHAQIREKVCKSRLVDYQHSLRVPFKLLGASRSQTSTGTLPLNTTGNFCPYWDSRPPHGRFVPIVTELLKTPLSSRMNYTGYK